MPEIVRMCSPCGHPVADHDDDDGCRGTVLVEDATGHTREPCDCGQVFL